MATCMDAATFASSNLSQTLCGKTDSIFAGVSGSSAQMVFNRAFFARIQHDTVTEGLQLKSASKFESQFLCGRNYRDVLSREQAKRVASRARHCTVIVVARLFGPAIFEASKLNVLFLGEGKDLPPDEVPRKYTLTHSDLTAKLTLAISQTINIAQIQGWYSRLQRDEVLAEWKKSQGAMSLHVHCHISEGHWLRDAIARMRFYIFRKELPVVLEAFRYGDKRLFTQHPELEEALVWVYFHSNVKKFNRVECWGPVRDAAQGASEAVKLAIHNALDEIEQESSPKQEIVVKQDIVRPERCSSSCNCCFPPRNFISLPLIHSQDQNQKASCT